MYKDIHDAGVCVIAFGNKERVGKDTAGEYLVRRGYTRLFFAEGVYEVATATQLALGLPVKKDPALLMAIGQGLKKVYGEDVWVRRVAAKMREHIAAGRRKFVITDLRMNVEAAFLAEIGAKTVRVTRKSRQITRDPNHVSETELDNYNFDHVIENDGTIEEFYEKIEYFAPNS